MSVIEEGTITEEQLRRFRDLWREQVRNPMIERDIITEDESWKNVAKLNERFWSWGMILK